jgi:hypothetical protein
VNGLHLLTLIAGLATAYGLHALARLLSRRAAAKAYDQAVTDALLLLAEDRAVRAEQHADDAQVLLNSILGHPATRDRQLTVIPGGAR